MKLTRTLKYKILMKTMGITVLSGILVTGVAQGTIQASGHVGSSQISAVAANTQINASFIQKAENKIKELTGKSCTLKKVTNTPSGWIFAIEGASGGEVILNKSGEIDSISIKLKWAELSSSHQKAMETALDTVISSGTAQPDFVRLSIDYTDLDPKVKNKLQLTAVVENTTVIVLDGKFNYALEVLNIKNVPSIAVKAAESVIAKVESIKKKEALTQAFLITKPDSVQYEFRFGSPSSKYPVSVNIDKKTTKAKGLYLGYLEDQVANKSEGEINKLMATLKKANADKIKKTAVPQIKQWLGMDLSGYNFAKVPNEPGNAIFTKSGKASVPISYNSKGELYWVN